jgi:DNA-binding GntR family transcriptional regulator
LPFVSSDHVDRGPSGEDDGVDDDGAPPTTGSRPSPQVGAAAEDAHERLRDLILSGTLKAGSTISQVQIAKELGVSRTPLREAIRRLQQEGLLIGEVNRRIRVADAPLAEFDSLCALRIVSEALAVRLTIPQLTDDDLARVESILDRLEEGEPRAQEPWWEDLHREFHLGLISGAFGLLKGMIDSAYDHADRYQRLYDWWGPPFLQSLEPSRHEHRAILAAAKAREPQETAELLARHYARGALLFVADHDLEFEGTAIRNALALILRRRRA